MLAFMILAILNPVYEKQQPTLQARIVIDITQSMNTRDYSVAGAPSERLAYSLWTLKQLISRLPCGSAISLGVFTHQSVEWLFAPLEICEHLDVILNVLEHIDWRMAWAADSHIGQGIQAAMREIDHQQESSALVFMTDGQETPARSPGTPIISVNTPHRGLIVGVGQTHPSPIPLLDRQNHWLGFWENGDLQLPDPDAPYLSRLNAEDLQLMAHLSGMRYTHLTEPDPLMTALESSDLMTVKTVHAETRWIFLLAGLILTALIPLLT